MDIDKILKLAKENKKINTQDIAKLLQISRQSAHKKAKDLVEKGLLMQSGKTRGVFYFLPENIPFFADGIVIRLANKDLKEHEVLDSIYNRFPRLKEVGENVRSIFNYAFSEMMNNAIEHSESKKIEIVVKEKDGNFQFAIRDFGIGIFKNIMKKFQLQTDIESVQELLKGKTTTQPKAHSGEGIFFTSKIADWFQLRSYDLSLTIDNNIPDVFVNKHKDDVKGTQVTFIISSTTKKHLIDLFSEYESQDDDDGGFAKTKIHVKLYTRGTIHVSRSQARRILTNLEKFRHIVLDFDKVPTIGQAFADEIFRVFANIYPDIKIEPVNTNEAIQFMIDRVEK